MSEIKINTEEIDAVIKVLLPISLELKELMNDLNHYKSYFARGNRDAGYIGLASSIINDSLPSMQNQISMLEMHYSRILETLNQIIIEFAKQDEKIAEYFLNTLETELKKYGV